MSDQNLTPDQRRGIRAAGEKFKRNMAKGGMTFESVTKKDGVPTITFHVDEKPKREEATRS